MREEIALSMHAWSLEWDIYAPRNILLAQCTDDSLSLHLMDLIGDMCSRGSGNDDTDDSNWHCWLTYPDTFKCDEDSSCA